MYVWLCLNCANEAGNKWIIIRDLICSVHGMVHTCILFIPMNSDQPITDFEQLTLSYKLKTTQDYFLVHLNGPSQHLLDTTDFCSSESFRAQFSGHMALPKFNELKMVRKDSTTQREHLKAKQDLKGLLASYTVFVISRWNNLVSIQNDIQEVDRRVGIKIVSKEELVAYVPQHCYQSVKFVISQKVFSHEEQLFYPLNSQIHQLLQLRLTNSEYKTLLEQWASWVKKDIKQLPHNSKQHLKLHKLKIEKVKASYSPLQMCKEACLGLYGFKILVSGPSYEMIKLWQLVDDYFSSNKLTICNNQCVQFEDKENLARLLCNCGQMAISIRQFILLFKPSENFEEKLIDVTRTPRQLTAQDFMNLDFASIMQHKTMFEKTIRSKQLEISHMQVSEDKIRFKSNDAYFLIMKDFVKEFMSDLIQEDRAITSIQSQNQLFVLIDFYLKQRTLISVDQLRWNQGEARLRHYSYSITQIINKIEEEHTRMLDQLVTLPSPHKVSHHHVISQPMFLPQELPRSSRFHFSYGDITVIVRDYSTLYRQEMVVFAVNHPYRCKVLEQELDECGKDIRVYQQKRVKQMLSYVNICHKFRSFYYWKVTDFQGFVISDHILSKGVHNIIRQQKPIKIVVPTDYKHILSHFIKKIIPQIIRSKDQLASTEITLIVPDTLTQRESDECYDIIRSTLLARQNFRTISLNSQFSRINDFFLSRGQILKLSYIRSHQLTCQVSLQKMVKCSPLNAAVFALQEKWGIRDQPIIVSFPQNNQKYNQQVLVDMEREIVYNVEEGKVASQNLKKMPVLVQIVAIIKEKYRYQNYLVMYLSHKKILTNYYVYWRGAEEAEKWKVDSSTKSCTPKNTFHPRRLRKFDNEYECYWLTTHPQLVSKLARKISVSL